MDQSKGVVNDKWIKASVLAGLWAGIEIIAGSFLHNLRIPFSGTFLTLISIILVIGFFQIWPKYGIIWRAGLITALMKSISPSSVILGPMIAIALEGLIMEISVRIAGRNITGYLTAGILAMVGVLTHKVLRLYLLYGWDIFKIYEEMFAYTTGKMGFTHIQPMRAVLGLFLLYALLGALAAFVGYKLGQKAKKEQHSEYTPSGEINAKQWQQPSEEIEYSTRLLVLLIVVIPLMLFALSTFTLGAALVLTTPWFIFVFWRYRFAMRQLKKWLFWMQLLVILVLAWFFSSTSGSGLEGRLEALSGGMIMVLRALVVVTGFATLSTELRAPLMQQLFFRSGLRQLYISINHAFGILPMVIGGLVTPKQFILSPLRSITNSLRKVNSWHQNLVETLNQKKYH